MENFPAIPDIILALLFGILIPFVSGVRSAKLFREQALFFDSNTKKRFYLSNSFFLLLTALVVIVVWEFYRRPYAVLGFQWPEESRTTLVFYLTLLFCGLYGMDLLSSVPTGEKREKAKDEMQSQMPFMPSSRLEMPAYFIMCLSAGLFEEIVYRGFLVSFSAAVFKNVPGAAAWTVLAPALLFSLAHYYQGAKAVFKILVLSLLFGMIFYHSGSLLIVVILHFSVDWISGWLGLMLLGGENEEK